MKEEVRLEHGFMKANPEKTSEILLTFFQEHAGQKISVDSDREEGVTFLTAEFNLGLPDLDREYEQRVRGEHVVLVRKVGQDHTRTKNLLGLKGYDANFIFGPDSQTLRAAGWVQVYLK